MSQQNLPTKPKTHGQSPSHALYFFPKLNATSWLNSKKLDQKLLPPPFTKPIFLEQIHSNQITLFKSKNPPRTLPQQDGVITQQKALLLVVRTADCIPALVTIKKDKKPIAVGAFHAGRQGLKHKIPLKFLAKIKKNFPQSTSLDIFLGPSICSSCYTLSLQNPLTKSLISTLPSNQKTKITSLKNNNLHLDLKKWCILQLKSSNFKINFTIHPSCTKQDPSFFSYRAGDINQTNTFAIGLKKPL